MRAVFIGASTLAISTAKNLLGRGHEVVVIENDKSVVESLAGDLDCGIILGDGSRPAILTEADPGHTDVLFCLTGSDQANILAALVGRSLGFKRVITKIDDAELEHVCIELGLEDTIIPVRTISRHLADLFEGRNPLELSTMIREEARALSLVAGEQHAGSISELPLPEHARVVCVYRNGRLLLPQPDFKLKEDDEIVFIVHRDALEALEDAMDAGETTKSSGSN